MVQAEIKKLIAECEEKYRGYSPLEIAWFTVYTFCDKMGMQIEGEASGLELVLTFINKIKES